MIYGWRIVVTVQAGFRQNMDVQCVSYYSNTVRSVKKKKRVLVMILWDIYLMVVTAEYSSCIRS